MIETPGAAGETGRAAAKDSGGRTGTSAVADGPGNGSDPGEDVVKLKAEVNDLRNQLATAEAAAPAAPKHRLRSISAVVLIVVGSILAPIAGITVWVRNQVLSTDRYVATIAPLSKNPAIASVVATQVTQQLYNRIDLQSEIKDVLPPRADFIAAPLAGAIKSQTQNVAYKVFISDKFNKVWVGMNRAVHTTLVGVLTGSKNGAISADQNGTVTLNVQPLARQVIGQLDQRGITVLDKLPISKLNMQIVLIQAKGLVKAQQLTKLLDHAALFLPLLSLLCFGGAVALSPRHRRALMWSGIGLAASMAFMAVMLGLMRSYLISASAGHALTPAAAQALFDTMLRYLKEGLRVVFGIGLAVAFVAWLAGPSRPAVALRRAPTRAYRWVDKGIREQGWEFGSAGQWVAANRGVTQGGLVGLAVLLLIIWGNPGIVGFLVLAVVTGLLVMVVRNVAAKPPEESDTGSTEATTATGTGGTPPLGAGTV
jgi:hypothetical protein